MAYTEAELRKIVAEVISRLNQGAEAPAQAAQPAPDDDGDGLRDLADIDIRTTC